MAKFNFQATDIDDTPLKFGKYKDETPNEIAEKDPSYIVWMFENIEDKVCSKDLYKACDVAFDDMFDEYDNAPDFKIEGDIPF